MAGWEMSLSEAAQLEAGLRPVPFGLTLLRLISRPSQGDAPESKVAALQGSERISIRIRSLRLALLRFYAAP
ncbi:hypothetical protein [Puniceicoccus vermicola]|uniref:Uncharacterized protein n=1 Tax=Puniceicoccus vermicola TaxID=388746 RepID=A0A7X1B1X2_9BACT|nr:hypothetical protein [Puniceicoccus vermicola]MBC2601801.1 hypothetical protein [Puniceicoccus vermicola]MBC2602196.1 hypothetical protein [Puniceicoccus vermicola]MBC2604022.1 hypothetical protein [Puniceicoccus vermicola]